jgi:8-oxo-dGTP pyrophosphatase MutT (NUDIX family)
MRSVERRIVSAFIVSSDGKVLLGKKDPDQGGVYPNSWHNPGGGVDVNETDEEALSREVLEETGIDISQSEKVRIDDRGVGEASKTLSTGEKITVRMQFNIYKVVLNKPSTKVELIPRGDLVGLAWFPIDSLEHMRLTPPAIELIARKGIDWLAGAYNK